MNGREDNGKISSRCCSPISKAAKSSRCLDSLDLADTYRQDEAASFLSEGNKHFIHKKVVAAIQSYTEGLKHFQYEEVEEEENSVVENEPKGRINNTKPCSSSRSKRKTTPNATITTANTPVDPVYLELLSNRAACYLVIRNYPAALSDTQEVLSASPRHIKAIFRQAKALAGLEKYQNAINLLNSAIKSGNNQFGSTPDKQQRKQITDYITQLKRMKHQFETGDYYDIPQILEKPHQPAPADWVDFISRQVKVQTFPDRGRGLVATQDLPATKLILACRAFEIVYLDGRDHEKHISEESWDALKAAEFKVEEDPSLNLLARKVYDRLTRNPEKRWDFYKLHAGNDLGHLEPPSDCASPPPPPLEMARVYGICRTNTFANSGDSYPEVEKSVGIWLFPAFVNHQCIGGNCTWKIFGDFIFVRTLRPVRKGEELTHSYVSPAFPFQARKEVLTKRLGFTCGCILCELDRTLPQSTGEEKKKLNLLVQRQEVQFSQLDSSQNSEDYGKRIQASILLLEQIISKLEAIHPKHGMYNASLLDPLQKLGLKYFGLGEFQKATKILERAVSLMKSCMLPHGVVDCSLWIVASYLQMRNLKKAKKWGEVLREHLLLSYGDPQVLKVLGAWAIEPMTQWGFM